MSRSPLAALGLALVLLVAAGCTDAQRAEQQGQDIGDELCDVRDADDQAEAQEALADVEREIDELADDHASFTAEDRSDIRENLDDLAAHVIEGDDVLAQQDLAVIRANVDAIEGDVDSTARAAASGVLQGLDDCI